MRGWRHWLLGAAHPEVPANQTPGEQQRELLEASGSDAGPTSLKLKKRMPPRCALCKKFMGASDGFQIFISDSWRMHTKCFEKTIDEYNGPEEDAVTVCLDKIREETL